MHQQARIPPKVSSPASSPRIDQAGSSRPPITSRESALSSRPRAGSNVSGRDVATSPIVDGAPTLGPPAESVKKLDQIVQNFYAKAAALVLDSRIKVKPTRNANGVTKVNKWYQIETDEIDDFKDELKTWKISGSIDNQPPPMIIEVYLDTSRLKDSQTLVILDDDGKRWDVLEQLHGSNSSAGDGSPSLGKHSEVVLERWHVELKTTGRTPTDDFGPILPTVYKKAIVFFRSLFVTTRLLPAWKFTSQGSAKNPHPALVPRCRIRTAEPTRRGPDLLRHPIDGRADAVTEYVFGDLDVPVGRLRTWVTYRNDCSFRIDDSEALLSSRFMGVDEDYFKPSLPQRLDAPRESSVDVESIRTSRQGPSASEIQRQTYGSLSTFHGEGAMGTSPISALRAVKAPGSDTSSPPGSVPTNLEQDAPHSLPVSGRPATTRAPIRVGDGTGRRPSISFQPFKAGSLSGSPLTRQAESESPASLNSLNRPAGPPSLNQPRNRTSLTAGMPASLRGGPAPQPIETPQPTVGSPRTASTSRYSSSFTHRRGRLSVGGTSRTGDEEQGSSGRQSLASSVAQPGSGLLAEAGASSGSLQADEDDIQDFLKVLDSKRTLKSFEPAKRGESATNKTVAQLSKFHMMKDSNNALTESMTSSVQMQRSSSSSSRQLTSVPGMVAPASMSASSSPGKPVSPHTPHTPAIPSRLSENSIIDQDGRASSRGGRTAGSTVSGPSRQNTITQDGTTAIDIPLSPRPDSYQHQRRSSSVAHQNRTVMEDEDADLAFAAHRSISLGADDREPPTMSILLGRQMQLEEESTIRQESGNELRPAAEIQTAGTSEVMQRSSAEDQPLDGFISTTQSSSLYPRRRYAGMAAAAPRSTPPASSRGSFTGSLNRVVRGDEESLGDEPLVFDLSEMDALGRRSVEEGRDGYGHHR